MDQTSTDMDVITTLDDCLTELWNLDRQAKHLMHSLSRVEYIWNESTAAVQRLRVQVQEVARKVSKKLDEVDPLPQEGDEQPTAPSTPTNPNPWNTTVIPIGISLPKATAPRGNSGDEPNLTEGRK